MSDITVNLISVEILELRSKIRKHNHLYYDLDTPEITDLEYDGLVIRLKVLSPNDSVLDEMGNPTYGTKVDHSIFMGSLDKVHTVEEIISKFNGKEVCIMPKVDGLSLACRYDLGYYDWAATRGNGKQGELVTPNAARIHDFPFKVETNVSEIRGEAYIPKTSFYGVMDQPGYDGKEDGYANPRNAAAGALRQKNPQEVHNRHLRYVTYKIVGNHPFKKQFDVLRWLMMNGFKTVDCWIGIISEDNREWLEERIEYIKNSVFDYNIDGVVIMLNDIQAFNDAGHGAKCPKGAIAYKYETEQVQTIARTIDWVANRSGAIVPTLNFDETEIDGTMVSRASLHNYSWVIHKDIANGDTILFTKANEIIPYVTEVVSRVSERNRDIPEVCPSCSGPTTFSRNETGEIVHLMCLNENCPAKFIKHIRRILQILDVKGMDEKTLIKMEDAGLLENVWDILDIDTNTLISKGFGKGESPKWVEAVSNITTTPQCLLACMGIIGWGRRMFEILFKDKTVSPEQWVNYITCYNDDGVHYDLSYIRNVDQLGDKREQQLIDGIEKRWNIVEQIFKRVTIEYPEVVVGGILAGKTFCATGTLTRKRKEIYADIIALGGEIKSGVSKELDYLITGDSTGSKLTKAQKLGIEVINEDKLNELMGI